MIDSQKTAGDVIQIHGAFGHNLKDVSVEIPRNKITVVTGVSGSGKSTLVFDTLLAEAKHHFFRTLSHFHRGLFQMGEKAKAHKINGLSLAISLEQAETAPSSRSTVATITNIGELLGVLWSRYGQPYCPTHHLICESSLSAGELSRRLVSRYEGRAILVLAPQAKHKLGLFRKEIYQARSLGCEHVWINGQIHCLNRQIPSFHPRKKYTVKTVVGHMMVRESATQQLSEWIMKTSSLTEGYLEIAAYDHGESLKDLFDDDMAQIGSSGDPFSLKGGCPECGFSWPDLDSRYFSQNSVGRCPECEGFGVITSSFDEGVDSHLYHHHHEICEACDGTGLNSDLDPITLMDHSLRSLYLLEIDELFEVVQSIQKHLDHHEPHQAHDFLIRELQNEISRVQMLGLGHLSLSRRILSLSHGERQRLRLSGILTEPLSGVLYILDEPSQGLHPADLQAIWANIELLRSLGNTIVIVDHDEFCWQHADHIIELGPGGGKQGGQITANFAVSEAHQHISHSLTARILDDLQYNKSPAVSVTSSAAHLGDDAEADRSEYLTFKNVNHRHLNIPHLRLKKAAVNVVTGVSGVGKTTLVMGIVAHNLRRWHGRDYQEFVPFDCTDVEGLDPYMKPIIVDRKPMGKSSVSMPATYLGCMGHIRDLYASLPAAQLGGLTRKHFSLMRDEGRCRVCQGRGYIIHKMKFLADARQPCPACGGQRFQPMVLRVLYKNHCIADLLEKSLTDVADLLSAHRQITQKIRGALSLGLGYLSFGQPSRSLSGGESQRLKLAAHLRMNPKYPQVLLIDEPTRGLHQQDVKDLMRSLKQMSASGTTMILVEHHPQVLEQSDWLVDLGHGSGRLGGQKIFEGNLKSFYEFHQRSPDTSLTARHLFD